MALPPGRVRGKCLDTLTTFRIDSVTESGWEVASVGAAAPFWTLTRSTQKPAAQPKPRGGTTRAFTPLSAACNWQTRALPRNAGDAPLRNPGRLLSLDAVRPWTCVWPPPLQRQLAEMLHWRHSIARCPTNRNEIGELMQQGIHHSPLVWTADAAASSRHSNASARGRHRLQPKRAASVGEIPSSQVENNPGVSELRVGDLYAGRLGASLRDPLFLEC